MTALHEELAGFIHAGAAPIEAIEQLAVWLECDDDEAAVMLCDKLRALCCRTNLQPAQARQRIAEMLRHMLHALDQVT